TGDSIYSVLDGTVIRSDYASDYGHYVVVDHGDGLHTLYAHCSERLVEAGDKVKQGDEIALVGSTGASTGPHLHFEVRVNNERINPLNLLPQTLTA
ncbi:MAG: M23 family metallopeptidase, partial [Acutalibacteraceae bacterium]|nr:M23 family metallopeptidase [Acutalibacteraceae bacterium]